MWKFVVGSALCAMMGVLLSHMGYYFTTWEFWAAMFLMAAYGVNSSLDWSAP